MTHQGEGPAKQNETAPLEFPTHTSRTTTARKLKMESPQQDNTPVKERNLVKSKVDVEGGTGNNSHAQAPAQGREKGKANGRQQYHANPMDPSVGTPTQGAKRGVKNKKSRDSETTGPPPQAAASIGNTRSKQKGNQSHQQKANAPYRPDEIPTNKDTEPTAKDEIDSPAKTEETSNLLHQAGTDLVGSTTGYEGHCPHGRTGKPERPDKESMRQDSSNAPKQRQSQPHQTDRIALNPRAHPTTQKVGRGPLSGSNAQEPDGLNLVPQSASTVSAESTYTASSGPGIRREEQLTDKCDTHTTVTPTLPTEGAKAALPGVLEPVSANTKDNEPAPTLTQAETTSIEKRRRRQARAREQAKNSTACFHLGTPILVNRTERAIWIPIYKAERGDIVVQSLPSGIIEDLTDALMTKIEMTCIFDCPAGGIDIVQMGEALITAHHYIQTAEGWMTARQAAHRGQGALDTNLPLPRVYSLCLERGGNIITNVTAHPQDAPKLITAATMGCRFEPAVDPKHKGSLTYPTPTGPD